MPDPTVSPIAPQLLPSFLPRVEHALCLYGGKWDREGPAGFWHTQPRVVVSLWHRAAAGWETRDPWSIELPSDTAVMAEPLQMPEQMFHGFPA